MLNLTGKKFIVTGGSRGIGAGIAKLLADEGAQLAFTYASRPDAAESVLKDLAGSHHSIYQLNVSDEESVTSSMNQMLESLGGIDGLVNNAGITKDQLILRMKTADFDDVIQTNLRGTYLCTKAVLKPMMKAKKGSIVNLSSIVAQKGNPGQANYVASKAAIEGMSRSVALELASRNIRVNCVAPGFIATEMTDQLTDQQKQAFNEAIPMGRMGEANDVATAVAFLLSDASNYITGQTLHVNGGLYM